MSGTGAPKPLVIGLLVIVLSSLLLQGLYLVTGAAQPAITIGRFLVILLASLLVWRRRKWARWILLLFALVALFGVAAVFAPAVALTLRGLFIVVCNAAYVAGVVLLFVPRVSSYLTESERPLSPGSGAAV